MLVINDVHIGVKRKAGTTPASQLQLSEYVFTEFEALLNKESQHVVINGDLFDTFEVEGADLIRTFGIIADWFWPEPLSRRLTLIAGNHDWSPKAGRVSSFHMLSHFLQAQYGELVQVIDHTNGLTKVQDFGSVWAIPHMANQDLFDIELNRAMVERGDYLLLHANYDNNFAAEADHSLNVSREVAAELIDRGWTLIFGHEHQTKLARGIIITGNQIPTSVSDCLVCTSKSYLSVTDAGHNIVNFMDIDRVFARVDWQNLGSCSDRMFIRVEGEASAAQATEVVEAVAKLRQKSDAFVVSNAVKVEGMAEFDQLAEMNLEQITSFNVLESLLAELSEDEGKVVKELLVC